MQSTTIYLESVQMKQLRKKAKKEDTTFSEQVRNAIDQYLRASNSQYSEEELNEILEQARKSTNNIVKTLEQTSTIIRSALPRILGNLKKI